MERSRILFILVGVVVGAVGTFVMMGWHGSPVQAQTVVAGQAAAKPQEAGRYQISSWGVGSMGPTGKMQVANGAYIIDSQTGDVFSLANEAEPKRVGSVRKKD